MARRLTVSPRQPGAYPTIRDALESATDGVVIAIAPGEYRESLALQRISLSIVASGEPGSVTVDAGRAGEPAVSCRDGDVTLRGLVLRAGDASGVRATGGRLRLEKGEVSAGYAAAVSAADGATLDATDVKVTGGQYGFVFEDAGGVLDKCEVRDIADDAVIVRVGANPTIRNSTIARCGFRGVYAYQAARPTIERCDI